MRCIRPWGLLVFIALVALFAGGWFLFVDGAVRCAIERTGTRLVGAKVELKGADLSLFPAGLVLNGLDVTNPEEPMRNALSVERAAFSMDGVMLFKRKVIVEEVEVEGVRLNTPRKTSGAISAKSDARGKRERPAEEAGAGLMAFKTPALKPPSVEEILAAEELESVKVIESLRADIKGEEERWRARVEQLLGKEKIGEYKKRTEGLKSVEGGGLAGLITGAAELTALQKDLEADLDELKQASGELDGLLKTYEARVEAAARAPEKDIERLVKKYASGPAGVGGVSGLLFGEKVRGLSDAALKWYGRLGPVVERAGERRAAAEVVERVRGKGAYVRFSEKDPVPDLLIRRLKVSVETDAGPVKGVVSNITPDQDLLGAPLTFGFSGSGLAGLKSLDLKGTIDRMEPSHPKDSARLKVKGYRVKGMDLAGEGPLPVRLDEALADLSAEFKVDTGPRGKELKGKIRTGFSGVRLTSEAGPASDPILRVASSALKGVRAFTLNAVVTGTLQTQVVTVTSDLDSVLKKAFEGAVKEQALAFRKELGPAIAAKTGLPLEALGGDLDSLKFMEKDLAGRLEEASGVLSGGGGALPGGLKLPF